MKTPTSVFGSATRVCVALPRFLFLWCLIVAVFALVSANAQTSQTSTAKASNPSKKAKSTQSKQTATKKTSTKQQLNASTTSQRGLARKKQAETDLGEAEEQGKFDILNPVQCSAKGMEARTLKKNYGDKLVFWGGGVDTQQVLPFAKNDLGSARHFAFLFFLVLHEVRTSHDFLAPLGPTAFAGAMSRVFSREGCAVWSENMCTSAIMFPPIGAVKLHRSVCARCATWRLDKGTRANFKAR